MLRSESEQLIFCESLAEHIRVVIMVRYVLNKCKVPVSEDERLKEPKGLAECRNPKALRKGPMEESLLFQRR
jgi:hypothetical protein